MRATLLLALAIASGASAAVRFPDAEITLPDDPMLLPAGPGVEAVRDNCLGCHSPSTMLQQPRLSREQWGAMIDKMVKVYQAPIDARATPAMIDYLVAAQSR